MTIGTPFVGVAERKELSGTVRGKHKVLYANTIELTPQSVVKKSYRWFDSTERKTASPIQLQIEFLEGRGGSPDIDDWLLLAPEIDKPPTTMPLAGKNFHVLYRSRDEDTVGRFHTYNDPFHRAFAEFIVERDVDLKNANESLEQLRASKRAVMLLYPVTGEKKRRRLNRHSILALPFSFQKITSVRR